MTGVQRNYFITSSEAKQLHEGGEGKCAVIFLGRRLLRYLDVLHAAAHQTALLKRIPADVKDLENRRIVRYRVYVKA